MYTTVYHFRIIWRWIIVTLKSELEVTDEGDSNWYFSKLGCGFTYAFHVLFVHYLSVSVISLGHCLSDLNK